MKTSLSPNNRKRNDRGDRSHARIPSITFLLPSALLPSARTSTKCCGQAIPRISYRKWRVLKRGKGHVIKYLIALAPAYDFPRNVTVHGNAHWYVSLHQSSNFLLKINTIYSVYHKDRYYQCIKINILLYTSYIRQTTNVGFFRSYKILA